jgi:hypothetical protein
VAELDRQLALPSWRDGDRSFALRPTDVPAEPERSAEQYEPTLCADLGCPIHVTRRSADCSSSTACTGS